MNTIGFDIRDEKEKTAQKTETKKGNNQKTANDNFKDCLKDSGFKKGVDTATTVLKVVSEIGNGVIVGSLWAICTCFPAVGIPLKICAGVSGFALHEALTKTTDKIWDSTMNSAMEFAEELANQ